MGWLKDRVEGALGLGRSDEPRPVAVEARRKRVDREVRSTPGARVRLSRDGRDGDVQRALLWCVRRGLPVELIEGPPAIFVDGQAVSLDELRERLG